ncbi:MAG TPA: tail fiber domain-containing protein [Thermoanaerobaculia bacterium]|jgi:hypothetical protein
MVRKSFLSKLVIVVFALTIPLSAFAKNIGKARGGGASIEWDLDVSNYESVRLTILDADGVALVKDFKAGKTPSFRLADLGGIVTDGQYTYQLTVTPTVSSSVKKQLAEAREQNDEAAARKIMKENGLGAAQTLSGVITIINNSIVAPGQTSEPGANDQVSMSKFKVGTEGYALPTKGTVTALDQVIPDDLIVQSSTCTGFDCVDGESFGFDTLRLKENNLRINFDDTSTSAGYPNNDWRIIANGSDSGSANMFAIEDSTAARNPMTIEAAAPANSLYVDSTGNIGLQQAAPLLDVHLTTTDTPAIRLEQTNAGGFTAQTWDVGGNEANFFIRDLTGGSRLSFRIRPGAPTSSIDIGADGDVGFGTASPNALTKVDLNDSTQLKARLALTGQEFFQASNTSTDGVALLLGLNRTGNRQLWIADTTAMTQNTTNMVVRVRPSLGDVSALYTNGSTAPMSINRGGGNVGIGTTSVAFPLQVGDSGTGAGGNGAHVTAGGTWTNGSSRSFKQDIVELDGDAAMEALANLKPVKYHYKAEPNEEYVGFIAEDVPELVAQTSSNRKYISPMDVVATLTKVVQEQQKQIEDLTKKVDELQNQQ